MMGLLQTAFIVSYMFFAPLFGYLGMWTLVGGFFIYFNIVQNSFARTGIINPGGLFIVADPDPDFAFHFDPDPDPAFLFDADPDPAFHSDADPDPTSHCDADPDPIPTFQFDPDPDPTTHFFPDLNPPMVQNDPLRLHLFTLMRIQLSTLMRIRIQLITK